MASKYWIKLYHEILDDPKMGRLSDSLWRRFIECCLLAGELDADGALPPVMDMAWRLRMDETALTNELDQLARFGMLEYRADNPLAAYWNVTKFAERQAKMSAAERMARHRERQKKDAYYGDSYATVTNRNTDIDKREEKNRKEREGKPAPIKSDDYWVQQSKLIETLKGGQNGN